MKKIIGFLSLIALFTISACTNRKPAEAKKEVKVAPSAAPATTPEKKTTIVLDKNGAKVATKKVEVSVN
jgi:hypothetical protein